MLLVHNLRTRSRNSVLDLASVLLDVTSKAEELTELHSNSDPKGSSVPYSENSVSTTASTAVDSLGVANNVALSLLELNLKQLYHTNTTSYSTEVSFNL